MQRAITQKLLDWRASPTRKPLILQGMRQVGKTYALKDFGQRFFPQTHYFNFEKETSLEKAFLGDLDPKQILLSLSLHQNKDIRIETDLIIFDEIQACPRALTSLKYFCEEMPQIMLCAAGSLLGIHLNSGSYPVGKVDMLRLYPMNFLEFLLAIGETKLHEFLIQYSVSQPINELIHARLWQYLKYYFVVGGLPEVVHTFATLQSELFNAFEQVRVKQLELIVAYQADIAKHSGKVNAMHIDRIWRAIPPQLARSQNGSAAKFKFKGVIPNIDRYDRMADAIDWLCAAQLVIKQPIVQKAHLPLSAYSKENTFKLYVSDVGILGALSDLSPKTLLDYDYGSYKGYFAENFVAQAFLASGTTSLYSWEEAGAEVEFLREVNSNVIPVEVKSGWVKRAKSLQTFSEKYHPPYSVIFSASNQTSHSNAKIHYYPLYLSHMLQI